MAKTAFKLSPASKKYLGKLKSTLSQQQLNDIIIRVMDRQAALSAGFISQNYLAGQRLNRVTGTLSRSIVGSGFSFGGAPAMRIGIFAGPALAYAGILEEGTSDVNADSPYSNVDSLNRHRTITPRFYLRDGMEQHAIPQVSIAIENRLRQLLESGS